MSERKRVKSGIFVRKTLTLTDILSLEDLIIYRYTMGSEKERKKTDGWMVIDKDIDMAGSFLFNQEKTGELHGESLADVRISIAPLFSGSKGVRGTKNMS